MTWPDSDLKWSNTCKIDQLESTESFVAILRFLRGSFAKHRGDQNGELDKEDKLVPNVHGTSQTMQKNMFIVSGENNNTFANMDASE